MEEKACNTKERKKTVRSEEEKKNIISRVNRIVGQLNGVRTMVEDDRYCEDILVQLAAVEASAKSLSAVVLRNHLQGCVVEEIKKGNTEILDEVIDLFKRYS